MESSSKASDIEENLISHHDEHSEQSSSISGDCDMQESHKEKLAEKVCVEEQKVISSQMQDDFWICAICLDTICIEELAQIKGCEHAYCVTCILRWASYKANCWCPQCKYPFSFLYVYKALDGSLHDYMCEESVCLLLRASWYKPVPLELSEALEEHDEYHYDYDDEAVEEYYYTSNLRIGNRRWGDNGYVRAGRREARPIGVRQVQRSLENVSIGSSSGANKGKEVAKPSMGRRAKRALKREAANKGAPSKC
eukprot:TRINITY_DN5788_c0_g2_i2.p1 TRINITY_DN5788_c0_g2~~TRINITY_DN5788_c0_g2_i2.p1  ORF type:complete len:253 (+),score=47.87 TRINITY_DN5788_c0_g2_i2:577-1335(+)